MSENKARVIERAWPDVLASMRLTLGHLSRAQESTLEGDAVARQARLAFEELAACWARLVKAYDDAGLDLDDLIRADLIREEENRRT